MTTETSNTRGEWVLVPRVPTEAMLASVCSAECSESWTDIMRQTYIAMLEAAPPPTAERGDVRGLVAKWQECGCGFSDPMGGYESCPECGEALAAEGVQAGEVEQRAREVLKREPGQQEGESAAGYALRIATATLSQQPEARGVVAEDMRWCEDIAESLREAGGPTNNMRLVALNRLLRHARTAPPSAPVGVEAIIAEDEAGWALAKRAEAAGAERDESDDDLWWTLRIEQFKALAQQPAAVDGAMARRLDDYLAGEFDIRIGKQAAHAALCHALATQHQEPTTQGKKHDGPCWRNSHADCGC